MFFFFNDTATTEIYTLSLHDALPICGGPGRRGGRPHGRQPQPGRAGHLLRRRRHGRCGGAALPHAVRRRSEEHTSELQSRQYLVCRLLLEKKKNQRVAHITLVCPITI